MLGTTALLGALLTLSHPAAGDVPATTPVVEVEGARLVDEEGNSLQLRGVNRAGTEYACVQGFGIFDGPMDDEAIAAMVVWQVNAVRIPLNEDCWLGDSRLDPALSGSAYRQAIAGLVDRLADAGLIAVLDLHWTGEEARLAGEQQPMARAGTSPELWRSVATVFRDREGILFDVFNEPHSVGWQCWRDGCEGYAGMQDLIDAIRSTGATQPIIVSGLDWGGDLRRWREFRPEDPAGAIVAGVHLYDFKRCVTPKCWDAELMPVASTNPVVVTEFGDTDCNGDFSNDLMRWADNAGVSYLAWTWNDWDCDGGPAVISSFDGQATPYGEIVRQRLETRAAPPDRPHRLGSTAIPV